MAKANLDSWAWCLLSPFRRRARSRSSLAKRFMYSLAVIQSIVVAFFYSKTRFEPEPKHVPASLGVQAHKKEAKGLGGGVIVEVHDRLLVVDARKLLA